MISSLEYKPYPHREFINKINHICSIYDDMFNSRARERMKEMANFYKEIKLYYESAILDAIHKKENPPEAQ